MHIPGNLRILTSRNSLPDYLRKIAKEARREGWVIGMDGNTHIVFCGPEGQHVRVGGSPKLSGGPMKKAMASMRRAGVPGVPGHVRR